MSKLIYFNSSLLNNAQLIEQIFGLDDFLKIQQYSHPNAGIKDRTGTIKSPFDIKLISPLPELDLNFNLSYKECILSRVTELETIHTSTGKTFRLLYSGGIDSTAILAGFIEHFGLEKASQILEICCTPDSIDENPWAWQRYISQANFKIKSSMSQHLSWADNVITIMGEGNDHLFGGLGNGRWTTFSADPYAPVELDTITKYLAWTKKETDLTTATYCAEQYLRVAQCAPFAIDNMYLFNWWCKFALDWEAVQIRALVLSNCTHFPNDFLENGFIQFFNTENLQQWSMQFHKDNPDRYCENHLYKKICKDMILDILDIPEYAEKNKFMSWPRVHSLIPSGVLIDDSLTIHRSPLDFLKFVKV
jgi:hypothetical protein